MPVTTVLKRGYQYDLVNLEEFERIHSDIFGGREYYFETDKKSPFIIDCGAHIGISLTYFHSLYPHAQILAIEPNPNSFAFLQSNVAKNRINAELRNVAIAERAGTARLYISRDTESPWTWGDSLMKNAWYSAETTTTIEVPSVTLSSLITQPVDLLKIDVEGLETVVLREAQPALSQVNELYIEFHGSSTNPDNRLDGILAILAAAGFQFTLKEFGHVIDRTAVSNDDPQWIIIHGFRSTGSK